MKINIPLMACAIIAFGPLTIANAQTSPARGTPATKPSGSTATTTSSSSPSSGAATRTDVYHVHFTKAALGKSSQLADNLKQPDPTDPMSGHVLILRHQEGDAWDYCTIQHMGTKATVDAARPAPSPAVRDLSDWHDDTFVNGPSWSEFTKAMGIDESGKSKSAGSVYIVSVYRPAPGHRQDLEKMLNEGPASGDTVAGNVLLQHLEGGAWSFLTVARYNSWSDFATSESKAVADLNKNQGGWATLREHAAFHRDTVCDRIAP